MITCFQTGSKCFVCLSHDPSLYSVDFCPGKKKQKFKRSKIKLALWNFSWFKICLLTESCCQMMKRGQSDLEQTQFPAPPPFPLLCDSLIRVTHDSWVKPTLMRGIGLRYHHSFPINSVKQQVAAPLKHQTPLVQGSLDKWVIYRGELSQDLVVVWLGDHPLLP